MKKTILVLLIACIATFSYAQEQKYAIKGRTQAIPTDGKLMLIRYDLVNGRRDDTATIGPDGLFSFSGTVPAPQIGQLIFKSGMNQRSAVFYLENGQINIELKKEDSFPVLSGTPLNKDFNDYYIMMQSLLDSVNVGRPSAMPYNQFSKELKTEKLHLMQKFVPSHNNSLLTVYQLNTQVARFPDEVSELVKMYNKLNPTVQKTKEGKDMATLIKGLSSNKIGDTALNFSMPDTNGKTVSLTDFRGKYVLLDFWATWCAPCLEEMPNVVNAYQKYKNKDFTIVGVSLDRPDTKSLWMKMIKDQHMDWVQISDLKWWNSQAALLYNIQGVPANFLIDPSGKIIDINLRGARLQEKLAEIFKAK
jgi:peroxiredoxin